MTAFTFTRRGRVVLAIVVLALAMSIAAGGRTLNAVILSGTVALVSGYLQLRAVDPPSLERRLPGDDHVGRTVTVALTAPHESDGRGDRPGTPSWRPFVATVSDRLDEGLDAPDGPTRATVGEDAVRYRLRYDARGEHAVGPTDLDATDVFGLFEKRLTVGSTDSIVVYPERHAVTGWVDVGNHGEGILEVGGREEFDRLREYARGDSLRDVHWAATAKHGGLVVREYAAETGEDRIQLVGGTRPDAGEAAADRLAEATVSLALPISEAGVPVDCRLPNGTVNAEPTPAGRRRLRELTARTGPGPVSDDGDAAIRLLADDDGVTVETADRTVTFEALRANSPGEGSPSTERAVNGGAEREGSTGARVGAATDGGVAR